MVNSSSHCVEHCPVLSLKKICRSRSLRLKYGTIWVYIAQDGPCPVRIGSELPAALSQQGYWDQNGRGTWICS